MRYSLVDNIEDYKNKTINCWTILDFHSINKKSGQHWLCQCSCGTIQPVRTRMLVKGILRGCKKCSGQRQRGVINPFWKGGEFISSTRFTSIEIGAKHRKIKFDLTIKDLEDKWKEQNGLCKYTKIPLTYQKDTRDITFSSSLDRVDSKKGYIKGNIQWVLKKINVMKMALKEEEFIEMCKLVALNN